jgi:hypothetical protein
MLQALRAEAPPPHPGESYDDIAPSSMRGNAPRCRRGQTGTCGGSEGGEDSHWLPARARRAPDPRSWPGTPAPRSHSKEAARAVSVRPRAAADRSPPAQVVRLWPRRIADYLRSTTLCSQQAAPLPDQAALRTSSRRRPRRATDLISSSQTFTQHSISVESVDCRSHRPTVFSGGRVVRVVSTIIVSSRSYVSLAPQPGDPALFYQYRLVEPRSPSVAIAGIPDVTRHSFLRYLHARTCRCLMRISYAAR